MRHPPRHACVVNFFDDLPGTGDSEEFLELAAHRGVRIERIVSKGHVTPEGEWYDQAWAEWVLVAEGAAELTLADPDEVVRLSRGDFYFIAAHRQHRVTWTDPARATIWLAVHWPAGPAR